MDEREMVENLLKSMGTMDAANLERVMATANKQMAASHRPLSTLCEPKAVLVEAFRKQRQQALSRDLVMMKMPDIRSACPGSGLMKDMKFDRQKRFARITLAQMLPQRAYPDAVLHATVLTEPVVGQPGTALVIEDTAGHACVLSVYKQNDYAFASQRAADAAFPVGRKLAIFEPFGKLPPHGTAPLIRVDNPAEIEDWDGVSTEAGPPGAGAPRPGAAAWEVKKSEATALLDVAGPNFALAASLYEDALAAFPTAGDCARALHNMALAERRCGEGAAAFALLMHAAHCVDKAYAKPAAHLKDAPRAEDLEVVLSDLSTRRARAGAAPGGAAAARERGNAAFRSEDYAAARDAYAAAIYGAAGAARDVAILLANASYAHARAAAFDAAARYAVAAMAMDPTYEKAWLRWHAGVRGTAGAGRLVLPHGAKQQLPPAMRQRLQAEETRTAAAAGAAALMRGVAAAMHEEVGGEVGRGEPTFGSAYSVIQKVEELQRLDEDEMRVCLEIMGRANMMNKLKAGNTKGLADMCMQSQVGNWVGTYQRAYSAPGYVPKAAVKRHDSLLRSAYNDMLLQQQMHQCGVEEEADDAKRWSEQHLRQRLGLHALAGPDALGFAKKQLLGYRPGQLMEEAHALHRRNGDYDVSCRAWHAFSNSESEDVALTRGALHIFAGCSDLSALLRATLTGPGAAPAAARCVDDSPAACAKMAIVADLLRHGAVDAALEVWLSNLWSRAAADAFHEAAARVLADRTGLDPRVVWLLARWHATEAVAPGDAVLRWVAALRENDVAVALLARDADRIDMCKYLQLGQFPLGAGAPEAFSGSITNWATPKNNVFKEVAVGSVLDVMTHRDFVGAASFAGGVNAFFRRAGGELARLMKRGALVVECVCSKVEDLRGDTGGRPLAMVSWNNIFDYIPAEAATALMRQGGGDGRFPFGAAAEHRAFSMNASLVLHGAHRLDYAPAAARALQKEAEAAYSDNIRNHSNPEIFAPAAPAAKANTTFAACMLHRYADAYARAAFPAVRVVQVAATGLQDIVGFGSIHMRFATDGAESGREAVGGAAAGHAEDYSDVPCVD